MPYVYSRHAHAREGLGARLRSSSLGETPPGVVPFATAIAAARDALGELARSGSVVQRAATDPGTSEAGRLANVFATTTGLRLVNEAEAAGDAVKLARVQGSTERLIRAISPEIMPALVQRFLLMLFVGPFALLPPGALDTAKEAGRIAADEILPRALTDREEAERTTRYIKIGFGLAALFAVAYSLSVVRSFVPKK
ncbi:MAG: hypothetical protein EBT03_09670 [Betaproteobacteria bacterium]|nr:hypothetical protein [Betaproteobacteria bacterium]NCA16900.1 hypothetical protein [Betaproteobacteria bacterium]